MKKQAQDYVIFALDLPNYDCAMKYVEELTPYVFCFKVGLELFMSEGPIILSAIRSVSSKPVFLDLKLHDIPATVERATMVACNYDVQFITVHCDVGYNTLSRICRNNQVRILAVTVLTSIDSRDLQLLGYASKYDNDISQLVLTKAQLAKKAGCYGVVCSGNEIAVLRKSLGSDFTIITPGVRPLWSVTNTDDQKRIITPAQAVRLGADYIIIGRPIRNASNPTDAAKRVLEEIAEAII